MLWNRDGDFAKADFIADTQGVWIDGSLKLIVPPVAKAQPAREGPAKPNKKKAKKKEAVDGQVRLFDIYADPAHQHNLASELPDDVQRMRAASRSGSGRFASFDGADFAKK